MMTASYCDCLICRLEASFIAELSDDRSHEEFRLFAVSSPILAAFPTASELIQKLRDHDNHEQNPSSDEVLLRSSGAQQRHAVPTDVAAALVAGLRSDRSSHHEPDHRHVSFTDPR